METAEFRLTPSSSTNDWLTAAWERGWILSGRQGSLTASLEPCWAHLLGGPAIGDVARSPLSISRDPGAGGSETGCLRPLPGKEQTGQSPVSSDTRALDGHSLSPGGSELCSHGLLGTECVPSSVGKSRNFLTLPPGRGPITASPPVTGMFPFI